MITRARKIDSNQLLFLETGKNKPRFQLMTLLGSRLVGDMHEASSTGDSEAGLKTTMLFE